MIQEYLKEKSALIEKQLEVLLPEKGGALSEAARYCVLGGGKRIRPILTLATAEVFGSSLEKALLPACAIELIHNYSLVHDDLPCMDNDDFRRGKPSLHKAFNEGHAVLTGDYLLTYAFEVIAQAPLLTPEQKMQLTLTLAQASGSNGMIGGQVMDLECVGRKLNLHTLQEIHLNKTAALIRVCFEFGAIIAEAPTEKRELVTQMGNDLGLAFQIVDDILDADEPADKPTYPSLIGLKESKVIAEQLLAKGKKAMKEVGGKTDNLTALIDLLVHRTL